MFIIFGWIAFAITAFTFIVGLQQIIVAGKNVKGEDLSAGVFTFFVALWILLALLKLTGGVV